MRLFVKRLYTGKVYDKFPCQKAEFLFFATVLEARRLYNAILRAINKTNGLGGLDLKDLLLRCWDFVVEHLSETEREDLENTGVLEMANEEALAFFLDYAVCSSMTLF